MKPAEYPNEPAHLWRHFYAISRIPRPSLQEQGMRDYITGLADELGHRWRIDATGNLVVEVPATAAMQDRPAVIIQNHMDMVTVKTADKVHEFKKDPISLQVEDGWLKADRTTLGADNGVGCAAALALMTDSEIERPPLQLLFTVDEERGLFGALELDPDLLRAERMLNLDTEEWHELYVGCAGGGGWGFRRSCDTQVADRTEEAWSIGLSGLAGGHSGIQIHEQLGNAVKLLAEGLQDLTGVRLAAMDIGVAHNVIPREGSVDILCPAGTGEQLAQRLQDLRVRALSYLPADDSGLTFECRQTRCDAAIGVEDTAMLLDLVSAFPHGAISYSRSLPGQVVELSSNLAIARLADGDLYLESSYRFFNEQQSLPLQHAVLALARRFDMTAEDVVGYPGWQPDFNSPLLAEGRALHRELFDIDPAVKAIHAGLECGILKSKRPSMDVLSFGPTIVGAHSPTERLAIDTVPPFWHFLTALLQRL
ncbi:MAG: beta-Ala-His dipeptidase [Pseudomonadota bacterium]